ncbi:aminotransferase class V-fold PLP-dependent enzyme [Microbacterium sp. G2-8]|uniref:cysteine desulfurase family protein n=1 Tax=Microbacterium sp. G2-8 TaxID=2842454 RepID=UPI001C893BBC|nr:aminotransferase class V-fold PLP-dependent enzyme [Microbacterium sp. G2-8]
MDTTYLDHAATTPVRAEAREAWLSAQMTGNASSVHADGQRARRLLEDARERLAAVLDCHPLEIVFTSGGTEAVNLALKGLWWNRNAGSDSVVLPDGEHHATLDAVEWLRDAQGARVDRVAIDELARIPVPAFRAALGDRVAVATALVANNEVGTINDAAGLAAAAADAGVPLHLDAIAAQGHVPVRFRPWRGDASGACGLVALSLSGHKVGAPVGTGALIVSRDAAPTPLIHGGGQQRALRAGTQDVAGAAALAVAVELAEAEREGEAARLAGLRARLLGALRIEPRIRLLGDPADRLASNVHLHLPGAPGESVLYLLDMARVSASTGSACQAGVTEASHVVAAMGLGDRAPREVLRLSMGRDTTADDIDRAAGAILDAYARLVSN